MLSLTDFKEKQIILLRNGFTDDGAKLFFRNENAVFSRDGQIVNQLSCHKILAVFIVGDLSLSTVLLRQASSFGITIFFLKNNFEVYAETGAKAEGNYLLRMKQYEEKDDFTKAKKLVRNKLLNQARLLKKSGSDDYKKFKKELEKKLSSITGEKELLGLEGNYSKKFFRAYFKEMKWYKRMPRTKVDHYNLLLDIGYSFLFNYVDSLLRLYGFDTYKGFYHKLFFKRKSLACDLMEPFRCLIDRELLKAYRLGRIDKNDFYLDNGKYSLDYDKSRKYAQIFLGGILSHKEEIFSYLHSYYRHTMDDSRPFPHFIIR